MLDFNEIKKMPIDKLLTYYNALAAMCETYERERQPYFNPVVDSDRAKWMNYNTMLVEVKQYKDVVFNAMKERVFNDLDNYKAFKPEDMKCPIAKKPVEPVRRGRPKKKKEE